jgi:transposase
MNPMRMAGVPAAMTFEGAVDGDAFAACVAEILAPSLCPGRIVIRENLRVDRSAVVQQVIEAARCQVLFLPPSPPAFARIEQACCKRKTTLRRTRVRIREDLDEAFTTLLATITAVGAQARLARGGFPVRAQLL